MSKRYLSLAGAGVALAAALTVAPGASAGATQPAGGTRDGCPYKALCVHILNPSTDKYHWANYYECRKYTLNGIATWYINNQTPGTKATFYYPYAANTPGAFSKGRPPNWPYGPKHPQPTAVRPCPPA